MKIISLKKSKNISSLGAFKHYLFLLLVLFLITNVFSKEIIIEPGEDAHERLQEALILMEEGDILLISLVTIVLKMVSHLMSMVLV